MLSHKIQSGDSLAGLLKRQGIEDRDLARAQKAVLELNGLTGADLVPGKTLKLPETLGEWRAIPALKNVGDDFFRAQTQPKTGRPLQDVVLNQTKAREDLSTLDDAALMARVIDALKAAIPAHAPGVTPAERKEMRADIALMLEATAAAGPGADAAIAVATKHLSKGGPDTRKAIGAALLQECWTLTHDPKTLDAFGGADGLLAGYIRDGAPLELYRAVTGNYMPPDGARAMKALIAASGDQALMKSRLTESTAMLAPSKGTVGGDNYLHALAEALTLLG